MKKILLAVLVIAVITSCKKDIPKDYATLSGKISNPNSDSLVISNRKGFKKVIHLKDGGQFSDTLKITKGAYQLFDGTEYAILFIENGNDIHLTLDTKKFDETLSFSGKGSETSTYLAKKSMFQEKVIGNPKDLFALDKAAFSNKLKEIKSSYEKLLTVKGIDSTFIANDKKGITNFISYLEKNYDTQHNAAQKLAKGKPSPKFVNYENFKGGTTSLDDLKGNYVYIDVWATWCGPCKRQIPSLQAIEKEYHGKKIKFVSLSVDNVNGKRGSHEKWKKMVADKNLGGIQLFAPKDWSSDFVKAYGINGIPRFILIDPNGNIVSADAPRPSDPALKALFKSLSI